MEIMNQARGYAYLFGMLRNQQADAFCRSCNSFLTTLAAARENIVRFDAQHGEEIRNLPEPFSRLYADAKSGISMMQQPEQPLRQKKEGNCKLPEGVCFTKSALALLQRI